MLKPKHPPRLPACCSERDFLVGKVRCDNVHVLHKYSDPVNVNMTVREGAGWPLAGWPGRGWRGHSPLRILVLIGGGGGGGKEGRAGRCVTPVHPHKEGDESSP